MKKNQITPLILPIAAIILFIAAIITYTLVEAHTVGLVLTVIGNILICLSIIFRKSESNNVKSANSEKETVLAENDKSEAE